MYSIPNQKYVSADRNVPSLWNSHKGKRTISALFIFMHLKIMINNGIESESIGKGGGWFAIYPEASPIRIHKNSVVTL